MLPNREAISPLASAPEIDLPPPPTLCVLVLSALFGSAMLYFDFSAPSPAENIGCDEALLDLCESGSADEVLRFWESTTPFVVVGYGNHVDVEVNRSACEKDGVPILRRCSGGGAVVQAPGCLNYSLILQIDRQSELASITAANCHIMKRNAAVLSKLLHDEVSVEGYTDLAIDGRKFSGNAQRRKRTHLLFHGTFLLAGFDLDAFSRYLRHPSREPTYRDKRAHDDFVTCLPIEREQTKAAMRHRWGASKNLKSLPEEPLRTLVATRYARPAWNLKF
jgi:lipoate---protein ligase